MPINTLANETLLRDNLRSGHLVKRSPFGIVISKCIINKLKTIPLLYCIIRAKTRANQAERKNFNQNAFPACPNVFARACWCVSVSVSADVRCRCRCRCWGGGGGGGSRYVDAQGNYQSLLSQHFFLRIETFGLILVPTLRTRSHPYSSTFDVYIDKVKT